MGDNRCRVLIIDGQGGRIGKQLAEAIGQDPRIELTAAGTNSAATVNMMKGGVRTAATGENAVVVGCRRADIIAGPIGIVIADALMGCIGAQGVIVRARAHHLCMEMRGVGKQDSTTVALATRGLFATDRSLREEFLSLVR